MLISAGRLFADRPMPGRACTSLLIGSYSGFTRSKWDARRDTPATGRLGVLTTNRRYCMLKNKRVVVADPARGMDRVCAFEPAGRGTKVMPHGSRSQERPLKTTGINGDLGAETAPRAWRPIAAPTKWRWAFPLAI